MEETGDSTNALKNYRFAHAILPHDPIIIDHLGQPLFMQQRFDKALKYFNDSVVEQRDHKNGHFWLAKTYEETGRFDRAIDEWAKIDSIDGTVSSERKRFYDQLRTAAWQHGADGYWQTLINAALTEKVLRFYDIATYYAHLRNKEKSYQFLEQACQSRYVGNLMVELCWVHSDPAFQAIARKYHFMPE